MGYVVGKLGRAPEGYRVDIELTGPLERSIRVAVDGRAAGGGRFWRVRSHHDDSSRRAAVHPVAGGRTDDATGVELSGDTEVGARVVERLNFVI